MFVLTPKSHDWMKAMAGRMNDVITTHDETPAHLEQERRSF
jgi:hypothetical protein